MIDLDIAKFRVRIDAQMFRSLREASFLNSMSVVDHYNKRVENEQGMDLVTYAKSAVMLMKNENALKEVELNELKILFDKISYSDKEDVNLENRLKTAFEEIANSHNKTEKIINDYEDCVKEAEIMSIIGDGKSFAQILGRANDVTQQEFIEEKVRYDILLDLVYMPLKNEALSFINKTEIQENTQPAGAV